MIIYVGICIERGVHVKEGQEISFLRERGFHGDPEILIPWFFSGNWVKKEIRGSCEEESLISNQYLDYSLAGFFDE